jgi:hypothetical protein
VQRSYLGVLLPESLLHMLESYGPGVFAAALSGDHNTPEMVWTAAMRQQRLIPAMLQVSYEANAAAMHASHAAVVDLWVESIAHTVVVTAPFDQCAFAAQSGVLHSSHWTPANNGAGRDLLHTLLHAAPW